MNFFFSEVVKQLQNIIADFIGVHRSKLLTLALYGASSCWTPSASSVFLSNTFSAALVNECNHLISKKSFIHFFKRCYSSLFRIGCLAITYLRTFTQSLAEPHSSSFVYANMILWILCANTQKDTGFALFSMLLWQLDTVLLAKQKKKH